MCYIGILLEIHKGISLLYSAIYMQYSSIGYDIENLTIRIYIEFSQFSN